MRMFDLDRLFINQGWQLSSHSARRRGSAAGARALQGAARATCKHCRDGGLGTRDLTRDPDPVLAIQRGYSYQSTRAVTHGVEQASKAEQDGRRNAGCPRKCHAKDHVAHDAAADTDQEVGGHQQEIYPTTTGKTHQFSGGLDVLDEYDFGSVVPPGLGSTEPLEPLPDLFLGGEKSRLRLATET